jgi:hypothetical protein
MHSTKISGLAVDTEYTFHLVLRTSAGTRTSEKVTVRTHKMTDLSGITITTGFLPAATKETLGQAVERIGAKIVDGVRIDTTHFVTTEGRGTAWEKAVENNIPVVRPEWVEACEKNGRILGVTKFYLDAMRPGPPSEEATSTSTPPPVPTKDKADAAQEGESSEKKEEEEKGNEEDEDEEREQEPAAEPSQEKKVSDKEEEDNDDKKEEEDEEEDDDDNDAEPEQKARRSHQEEQKMRLEDKEGSNVALRPKQAEPEEEEKQEDEQEDKTAVEGKEKPSSTADGESFQDVQL